MVKVILKGRSARLRSGTEADYAGLSEDVEEMEGNEQSYDRAPGLDPVGEELSHKSKIWRIYLERARAHDKKTIENWDNGIDVLLVFAGLFSSVLTTILVQASTSLTADPNASTNALLQELVLLAQNNSSKSASSVSSNASIAFSVPGTARWINGLWFTSLALALSTALVSIMAKQWLQAYLPRTRGSLQEQVHDRQALFDALQDWHVGEIIEGLPIFLHVSLLLFFAGLVVFVWTLDKAIGAVMLAIVGILALLYGAALVLPLLSPTCPYHNPALRHIVPIAQPFATAFTSAMNHVPSHDLGFDKTNLSRVVRSLFRRTGIIRDHAGDTADDALGREINGRPEIQDAETVLQDINSLTWLTQAHTDFTVQEALVHAVAGVPLKHAHRFQALVDPQVGRLIRDKGLDLLSSTLPLSVRRSNLHNAELYCRASVKLSWPCTRWGQRSQNYVWPGFSEEMIQISESAPEQGPTPVHIYLTAFAHFLIERVLSGSSPLPSEQKARIIRFLPDCGLESRYRDSGSGDNDAEASMDMDISIRCLFLDCLARYLCKHPLSPVDPHSQTQSDLWTTSVLRYLLGIMVYTNANPISSELRVAAAHALFCAVSHHSVTSIPSAEFTLEQHRFEFWTWASDFTGPACYNLLNPAVGGTSWIPWLRHHGLHSVVVAGLCWYRKCPDWHLLYLTAPSVVQRLTDVLTDDVHGAPVSSLERKDCRSLLFFWRRILTKGSAAARLDAAIETFLSNLSPLVRAVDHCFPDAWSEAGAVFRIIFNHNRSYCLEAMAGFYKANGFRTIVRLIHREYDAAAAIADSNGKTEHTARSPSVKRHVGYLLDGLHVYTKLLLHHTDCLTPNDPSNPDAPDLEINDLVTPTVSPDFSKQNFVPAHISMRQDLSMSSPEQKSRAFEHDTAISGYIEEIFDADSAESDIFALFIRYPHLAAPLDLEFTSDSPALRPHIASSGAALLCNLHELRPYDGRWGEVHTVLSQACQPVPRSVYGALMKKLEQRFGRPTTDVGKERLLQRRSTII